MSWLLSGNQTGWPIGQPFGDGSERWRRARDPNFNPWDENCNVTPLLGGHETMDEIREAFEKIIIEAESGATPHVYIAGWRFNPNRDLSIDTHPWASGTVSVERRKQTAGGLIKRMIFAGVKVRILLWVPPTEPGAIDKLTDFRAHVQSHFYLARLVKAANIAAKNQLGLQTTSDDLGVVILDRRVSEERGLIASHHQKFIVIRGITTNVAFCGGIDLAYTRRDAPLYHGDWQSGNLIPSQTSGIADGSASIPTPDENQSSDLPMQIDNKDMYGTEWQVWHDQHLKLEGSIVKTLEYVFVERWSDPTRACLALSENGYEMPLVGSVIFSSEAATDLVFRSRKYLSMSDDNGKVRSSFFVDYGITKNDIDQILIDGQPTTESWIINTWGIIQFKVASETFRKWSDKPLEVQFKKRILKPLPEPLDITSFTVDNDKKAKVQVWLTIPFRGRARGAFDGEHWIHFTQTGDVGPSNSSLTPTVLIPDPFIPPPIIPEPPYRMGEFSNMAGISNACLQAEELIWIFDQYFWNVPYALLLKKRLSEIPQLHLIIVLPPWSDKGKGLQGNIQHLLRWEALKILGDSNISNRVAIYVPWIHGPTGGVGIYCHAKVQLFDDQLLVCGSCNINERSFNTDSELSCAVESEVVLQKYYKKLWNYFIKLASSNDQFKFPTPDFSPGWGGYFFNELRSATQWPIYGWASLNYEESNLSQSVTLPNNLERSTGVYSPTWLSYYSKSPREVLEPVNDPRGLAWEVYGYGTDDLESIVNLIHNYSSALKIFRRQHHLDDNSS
jgi:phosphatidylserine/phosphatidylglycerophosphate/cardiolipin synthase-like enzyme